MTALNDQLEELLKPVIPDGGAQVGGAAAVIVEVDGAHNGTVAHLAAQGGNGFQELLLVHFAQHRLAELLRHALHLTADGGVIIGQVGMAALGIADAQRKIVGGQIELGGAHHRVRRVLEVDGDGAAHGAGGLVHQAAGLAEEHVLGVLADLGDLDLREFLHVIVVVLAAEDRAHAHLERRRAGQAGAAQHIAGGVSVKAAHLAAGLHKASRHAADEARGMFHLAFLGGQDAQVHIVDLIKAVGLDPHHVILVGRHHCHNVQIDGGGHHHAVVVVGVVAADLGAAGGGIQTHFPVSAVLLREPVHQSAVPLPLGCQRGGFRPVQGGKCGVIHAFLNLLFQLHCGCHRSIHLSYVIMHK